MERCFAKCSLRSRMPSVFIPTLSSARQFRFTTIARRSECCPSPMATDHYVEWSSRFEIAPEREAQLVDLMNRNFLAGLRALAGKFSNVTHAFGPSHP